MKYTIYTVGLLILLVPLLFGCQVKPEDQWPVIASWTEEATLDVAVKIDRKTGVITVTWPATTAINLKIDVRTYNANQAFKVTTIAESVRRDYMLNPLGIMSETYPFYWTEGDPRLPAYIDHMQGDYVSGSGNPPQGISQLVLDYFPVYPFSLSDWYWVIGGQTFVVNRYIWDFLVIVEDAGGRTDTFRFSETANLKITF